jgi:hypothetical protein
MERMIMAPQVEYKVLEVREGLSAGRCLAKVERLLNEHARQGWHLKAITAVEVKGRVGPGGVEGVLITFEREVEKASS